MADETLPPAAPDLGQAAYEAELVWLNEIMPGGKFPQWGELDPEHREVYARIDRAVRDQVAAGATFERLLAIIGEVDAHLDANTAEGFREQPLAGHWARITKVCEEAGEVWKALSKLTGENPRKGVCGTEDELLDELGDTLSAAACAIQHITKDETRTAAVIVAALEKAHRRAGEFAEGVRNG
jgi:NTP pyrophosphatase (non-canonical NTP hydrolase)